MRHWPAGGQTSGEEAFSSFSFLTTILTTALETLQQPGRRSSTDPSRFYQDAGTSAKEPAISALGLEGKHLRGTNTDTHVQQPSDKITSQAKQVRQAADAGGVGWVDGYWGGWSQRCRLKDRQGAPLRRQETESHLAAAWIPSNIVSL